MHIKLGLVSALAVAASAHSMTNDFNGQHQVGKVYEHEYVQPNVEEVCFSVRQIAQCDSNHVASHVKHQRVGFHCLNKALPITKQFQRQADQGERLPFENKSQDVQAYVEVPVRCVKIDTEEKRLRKETENQSQEQKIHLVQNQDGEEESFLFEQKPWTTEQEQDDESYPTSHVSRSGKHQLKNSFDEDYEIEQEFETMNGQYADLINKPISLHRVLNMNEDQVQRLLEHLKFIAHQRRRQDWTSQQIDQILPNTFAKNAKLFFETVLEKQTTSQEEKEELYQQYKDAVKRIYAYVVKQALQMKNFNQIGQTNQEHIINKLSRNIWNKIQSELSNPEVEEIKKIAEYVQQNKQTVDRLADEVLVVKSREQMKHMDKELTRIISAGLKMLNHGEQRDFENASEQYKQYHSQSQQYQTRFPKLFQKLQIVGQQQWRN